MTNGIKALRQIQMSRETTQGTATTDFSVWRGLGTLQDSRESVWPEEDIGILSGTDRQYFPKLSATLEMDAIEATFEQLPHILDAGIRNSILTTDTGSDYIRTYTEPTTGATIAESSDLQTYSFKCGDNNEVEKFSFGFVKEFTLSGTAGEAWKIKSTWEGREVASDSDGFATVTIPIVEEMLFSKSSLYIDASSDTIGTTLISNTLISADLNVTTGWQSVYTGSGRLDLSFIKQVQPEIKLDITFEHNATATAEKAAWRNKTARLLQILVPGNAVATAGALYTYKTMKINLAGKWDSFEKIDEVDGNDVVTGHFIARYNSTAALFSAIIVVNEVITMP
ncbi:MAG: hypothetical protein WC107_05605 [Patescibacteria group bacterium]|jgi:hypothetical protein